MANICEVTTEGLFRLLDRARADDGATMLVPHLQRPYVWTPSQVSLLVDSLIRTKVAAHLCQVVAAKRVVEPGENPGMGPGGPPVMRCSAASQERAEPIALGGDNGTD